MKNEILTRLLIGVSTLGIIGLAESADAAPVNVAHLYGTITANQSSWSTNYASLVIDDDNTTRWVVADHGTQNDPNWVIIDLGNSFAVNSIDLYWDDPVADGQWTGYTTNYNVYYGSNGTDWTLVNSGQFIDGTGSLNDVTDHFDFAGLGQNMQFVKYEVDGGSHWSSVGEIRVFADDAPNPSPAPEPATLLLFGTGLVGLFGMRKRKK